MLPPLTTHLNILYNREQEGTKFMTIKAGKIWGETELILANNSLEFHRIDYKKGGVCSKHLHEWKWNGFYVMSGRMKIRVWQKDYDLVDETILNPGDFTAVKSPGFNIVSSTKS